MAEDKTLKEMDQKLFAKNPFPYLVKVLGCFVEHL